MRIGTAEASGRMQATNYADLYRDHRGRVLGLCRLMLADPDDAEEVGQEVFLRLHREMQAGDRPIAWGPWLTRVAVNACLDRRRARWWRVWRESSDELVEGELPGGGPDPETAAIGRQQRDVIWQAFRKLPARQREVFALRQVEGWSTEEVAQALGVSPGSVKRHLWRAILKMRSSLGGLK